MPETRASHEFVITWFPPDKPRRKVAKRTLREAIAYVQDNALIHMAPMIEEVKVVTVSTERIVWNMGEYVIDPMTEFDLSSGGV